MADYYYNPGNPRKGIAAGTGTTGNNTTVGNAYADLADLITKFKNGTSGNRFFIRCGSMQQVNALHFNSGLMLANGRGNLLSYYGDTETGEPFFFAANWYEAPNASGWSQIGAGRWQKTFATPSANNSNVNPPGELFHLWRQAQFGDYPREFGPDTRRVSSTAEVTNENTYHCQPAVNNVSGMVLTMWTPNGSTPPAYYGGLAFQSRKGSGGGNANSYWGSDALFVANNQDCEFRRMVTMGGKTRVYAYSSNGDSALVGDNLNLLFRDCAAVLGEYGAQVLNQTSSKMNKGLEFVNFESNFYSGNDATYLAQPDLGYEDGVLIQGYAEAIKFTNYKSRSARHAGFSIVPDSNCAPDLTWPRGVTLAGYDYDSVHKSYGHPLGVTCDGWTVTDAVMRNVANQCQLSGIGTLTRFKFINMQEFKEVAGTNNYGDDNAICVNANGSGNTLSTVKSIKISFGVIDNPFNFAIWIGEQTTATVTVENVVIADMTYGASKRTPSQTAAYAVPAAPVMHRKDSGGMVLDPQTFRNNLYLLAPGNTSCHVMGGPVPWGLTWDAPYAVNVLAGHTGNAMYQSMLAAGLDENFRPLETSPLLLAGNLTSSGHRDADGMTIPTGQALPIGAYAGKPLRTLAVLT